jgi:hypothetical protein
MSLPTTRPLGLGQLEDSEQLGPDRRRHGSERPAHPHVEIEEVHGTGIVSRSDERAPCQPSRR